MICFGRHVGGHAFALQHGGQNYFMLFAVQSMIWVLKILKTMIHLRLQNTCSKLCVCLFLITQSLQLGQVQFSTFAQCCSTFDIPVFIQSIIFIHQKYLYTNRRIKAQFLQFSGDICLNMKSKSAVLSRTTEDLYQKL